MNKTEQRPGETREAIQLNDAAAIEGVAPDALRMRFRRGTLAGYKTEDGRIFIYKDALRPRPNANQNRPNEETEQPALVEELRRQLERMERREAELLDDLRTERDRSATERERGDILLRHAQEQASRSLALLPGGADHAQAGSAGRPMALALDRVGPTVSTLEAAAMLGRSPRTLRQWASKADAPIRPLPLPGPHRWSTAELRRLLGDREAN